MRQALPILILLAASSSLARAEEADSTEALIDAISIRETKILVVPASDAAKTPPPVDDPVTVKVPALDPQVEGEEQAHAYLDPFIGRPIYPAIDAHFETAFVRETIDGGSAPEGNMALASRVALSLWAVDLRFPVSTSDHDQPAELALKIPFGAGKHRFAPTFVVHVPMDGGLSRSIYEAALGYQGAFGKFSVKLEISAFDGTFERTAGELSAGMFGWSGSFGYLLGDQLGVIVEVDGLTAISERVGIARPQIGDTVLHLYPGLRWFPTRDADRSSADSSRFYVGAAAVLSFVPAEYDLLRRQGAMFEVGYSFL